MSGVRFASRITAVGVALTAFAIAATPYGAAAATTATGRFGVAFPVNGDVPDDLGLDIGFGGGLSLGTDVMDFLALDVRYDALLLYGDVGNADSSSQTHALSF